MIDRDQFINKLNQLIYMTIPSDIARDQLIEMVEPYLTKVPEEKRYEVILTQTLGMEGKTVKVDRQVQVSARNEKDAGNLAIQMVKHRTKVDFDVKEVIPG